MEKKISSLRNIGLVFRKEEEEGGWYFGSQFR